MTSLHLRECFGDTIRIGGPAFCWWGAWKDRFVPFCAREKLPLDFYSFHCYFADPARLGEASRNARKLLDDNGFTKTETHLNEWNYVAGWTDAWVYTLECESGRFNQKGAAMIAAAMIVCQDSPLDLLMYYDARLGTGMNGMFDAVSLQPLRGSYPFLVWSKLRDRGTQVRATVEAPDVKESQLYATAAKGKDGRVALFLARAHHDDNVVDTRKVRIQLPKGAVAADVRCHLTDAFRIHTETPVIDNGDGMVTVKMLPQSFALVEF